MFLTSRSFFPSVHVCVFDFNFLRVDLAPYRAVRGGKCLDAAGNGLVDCWPGVPKLFASTFDDLLSGRAAQAHLVR